MRKAQISAFIIIGMITLLIVSLVLIIQNLSAESTPEQTAIFSGTQFALYPVDQYIDVCVEQELKEILEVIGKNGGLYNTSSNEFSSLPLTFEYYLYQNNSYLFHNMKKENQLPITPQFVSQQIDTVLSEKLDSCFSEKRYIEQGYNITTGSFQTFTTIRNHEISVQVDFPVSLKREDIDFFQDSFSVQISYPFGFALQTIRQIVNEQTEKGFVDQQFYMHQFANDGFDQPSLIIQKHTPYPHTLFEIKISEGGIHIPFYFGVEGEDVFFDGEFELERLAYTTNTDSCCVIENTCYSDITRSDCPLLNGRVQTSCSCTENDDVTQNIEIEHFSSCGSIKSGSSICQEVPGVGGVFQRKLCVDGEWLVEDCRDYFQEVCAQTQFDNRIFSQCRLNTAPLCGECETQECCESLDCQYVENSCLPKKSIGLPFWDAQVTQEYCSQTFSTYSSSIQNSLQAQLTCAQIGDCGLKPNYAGEFTTEPELFYRDRLTELNQRSELEFMYNYSLKTFISQLPNKNQIQFEQQSFSQVLTNALIQLDELTNMPIESFLNPENTVDFTQQYSCFAYNPPRENNCNICGMYSTCTEYSCNSLGTGCQYKIENGVGVCTSSIIVEESNFIEKITVNEKTAVPLSIGQRKGFKASEEISSTELMTISFQTKQPSLCRPTYLPDAPYSSIRSSDLSLSQYSTNHTLRIRFVNDLPIFEKIKDHFEVLDFESLVDAIISFKYQIDQLRSQYPHITNFNPPFYPHISNFITAYLQDETKEIMSYLVSQLEEKTFAVFFSCKTISGDEFSQTPFVLFSLQNHCVNEEPKIHLIRGDKGDFVENDFYVFTDQLSVCRFDTTPKSYDDLDFEMNCPHSIYNLSQLEDGYYQCMGNINEYNITAPKKIYIQCMQNENLFLSNIQQNIQLTYNESALIEPEISIQDLPNNITYSNQTRVTISFIQPYSCQFDDVQIPCQLDSCMIQTDLLKNKTQGFLSCQQRDTYSYCQDSQPIVQSEHTVFDLVRLENFSIQNIIEDSQLIVESTDKRAFTCEFIQLDSQIILDSQDDFVFLQITDELKNKQGVLFCEDEFDNFVEKTITLSE